MVFLKWLLSLVWGGGSTVTSILAEIDKTRVAMANTQVESDKVKYQAQLDTLHSLLADQDSARKAAASMPWWMAVMAFLFGFGFACHTFFIAMGTAFQPLIVGGWLDWWLHIPKLPPPYGDSELGIIGFFFGSAAALGAAGSIAKAIAARK